MTKKTARAGFIVGRSIVRDYSYKMKRSYKPLIKIISSLHDMVFNESTYKLKKKFSPKVKNVIKHTKRFYRLLRRDLMTLFKIR